MSAPQDPLGALAAELDALREKHLARSFRTVESAAGTRAVVDGRSLLVFGSNDYLGLAQHPEVRAAGVAAVERWGSGATGSRLTTGTSARHRALEGELADWKGTEDAILFGSGYLAAVGTIPALVTRGDLILSDALNHASLIDGCRLSRAEVRIYRHADPEHAASLLADREQFRRTLLVTDGVFSMDGDLAPLPALVNFCASKDVWLMVDDAHGTGVLGPTGAGCVEAFGLEGQVPIQLGTLSKALACEGGFVAGSRVLINWLRNRARSYVFSTAPAPATVAAAHAATRIARREPELRQRLSENIAWLRRELASLGLRVAAGETPILPVILGDAATALKWAASLEAESIWVTAIRPPTVPAGTARLRVSVTAAHTRADLEEAAAAFERVRDRHVSGQWSVVSGQWSVGGSGVRAGARPTPRIRYRKPMSATDSLPGVFVTGTDTGVGKTVIAAMLASGWRAAGLDVAVMKPVATGISGDDPLSGDARFLVEAAGGTDDPSLVCPLRFREPAAPLAAAAAEGREIDPDGIHSAFDRLRGAHTPSVWIVVEGAGGLLVPITAAYSMCDLARDLHLPLLIVARAGLGTINHTLLTVQAARNAGLCVLGVVINRFPENPSLAERTAPEIIRQLGNVPILGVIAERAGIDTERGTGDMESLRLASADLSGHVQNAVIKGQNANPTYQAAGLEDQERISRDSRRGGAAC